jgi:predicted nucleic acid-binding Zn ribbon protein
MLQKVSDAPTVTCPDCGKDQLQRLISATRFQLKGQGWYETDFKNKNKPVKKEAEAESKTTTETDQKSSSTTEKKTPSSQDDHS